MTGYVHEEHEELNSWSIPQAVSDQFRGRQQIQMIVASMEIYSLITININQHQSNWTGKASNKLLNKMQKQTSWISLKHNFRTCFSMPLAAMDDVHLGPCGRSVHLEWNGEEDHLSAGSPSHDWFFLNSQSEWMFLGDWLSMIIIHHHMYLY